MSIPSIRSSGDWLRYPLQAVGLLLYFGGAVFFSAAMLKIGSGTHESGEKKMTFAMLREFFSRLPRAHPSSNFGPGCMKNTLTLRQNPSAAQQPCTKRCADRLRAELSERMDELRHLLQSLNYAENPIQFHEILRELDREVLRAKALAEG